MLSASVLLWAGLAAAQIPEAPGRPVPFDRDRAIAFFDEVDCESGLKIVRESALAPVTEPNALNFLAKFYEQGHCGVKADVPLSRLLFRTAAEKYSITAMFNLGVSYGALEPRDPEQSEFWFRQAAERGQPWAMRELAMLYEREPARGKSADEILRLYCMSALLGVPPSQETLRRRSISPDDCRRRALTPQS